MLQALIRPIQSLLKKDKPKSSERAGMTLQQVNEVLLTNGSELSGFISFQGGGTIDNGESTTNSPHFEISTLSDSGNETKWEVIIDEINPLDSGDFYCQARRVKRSNSLIDTFCIIEIEGGNLIYIIIHPNTKKEIRRQEFKISGIRRI